MLVGSAIWRLVMVRELPSALLGGTGQVSGRSGSLRTASELFQLVQNVVLVSDSSAFSTVTRSGPCRLGRPGRPRPHCGSVTFRPGLEDRIPGNLTGGAGTWTMLRLRTWLGFDLLDLDAGSPKWRSCSDLRFPREPACMLREVSRWQKSPSSVVETRACSSFLADDSVVIHCEAQLVLNRKRTHTPGFLSVLGTFGAVCACQFRRRTFCTPCVVRPKTGGVCLRRGPHVQAQRYP